MSKRPKTNPAQVRGDIQHGRTGDKTRGFDPAAAPLETDDEAGGTPVSTEAAQVARNNQLRGAAVDRSTEYADAMRPLSDGEKASSSLQWLTIALPLAVLAIVIGALVYAAGAGLS